MIFEQFKLLTAIQQGSTDLVKLCVDAHPELATAPFPEQPGEKGIMDNNTPISHNKPLTVALYYLKNNNFDIVDYLIAKGASFDTLDQTGQNPIMVLARISTTANLNLFVKRVPSDMLERLLVQRDSSGNNLLFHSKSNHMDGEMPLTVLKLYPPNVLARELCWVNSDCKPGFFAMIHFARGTGFLADSVSYRTWAAALEPKETSTDIHDLIRFHQLVFAYSSELSKVKKSLQQIPKKASGCIATIDEWKAMYYSIQQLLDSTLRSIVKFNLEEKIGTKVKLLKSATAEFTDYLIHLESNHYGERFDNKRLRDTRAITKRILEQVNHIESGVIDELKTFNQGLEYLVSQLNSILFEAAAKNNAKVVDSLLQIAKAHSIPVTANTIFTAFWKHAAQSENPDTQQYFLQDPTLRQAVFSNNASVNFNNMLMDLNSDANIIKFILSWPEGAALILNVTSLHLKFLILNGKMDIANQLLAYESLNVSYEDWKNDYWEYYCSNYRRHLVHHGIVNDNHSLLKNSQVTDIIKIAAEFSDISILRKALKHCDIANNIEHLKHALFIALRSGHLTAVKCLLDIPEVTAAMKNDPVKALVCAVEGKNIEAVNFMFTFPEIAAQAGHPLNGTNCAALHKAVVLEHEDIVILLLSKIPEIYVKQLDISLFSKIENLKVFSALLKVPYFNSSPELMRNALVPAAKENKVEHVELLLAIPSLRTTENYWHYVAQGITSAGLREHIEVVNLLISTLPRNQYHKLQQAPYERNFLLFYQQSLRNFAAISCNRRNGSLAKIQSLSSDLKMMIFSKMGLAIPARVASALRKLQESSPAKELTLKLAADDVRMSEASNKREGSHLLSPPEKRKKRGAPKRRG